MPLGLEIASTVGASTAPKFPSIRPPRLLRLHIEAVRSVPLRDLRPAMTLTVAGSSSRPQ